MKGKVVFEWVDLRPTHLLIVKRPTKNVCLLMHPPPSLSWQAEVLRLKQAARSFCSVSQRCLTSGQAEIRDQVGVRESVWHLHCLPPHTTHSETQPPPPS